MPSETVAFEHYRVLLREDGSVWELGRGAMGVTYKAIDDNLHKVVALKVINGLHVDKESSRDRFLREARAAASLNHRNVAVVHHLGQNAQNFFYAMEFIDGETVEALVKRAGPLAWREALGIVIQVTRALMAAHEKRLVHRDIKPPNIMLVPELGEDTALVKLIDFGLAKTLLEEDGSMVGANASGFVGTPLYASPEQCNEEAPDIRSDIYSLGVTLWYMLTGHPLFSGSMAKVFGQHLSAPPPLDKLPADVPASVRALLGGMLAKERDDRPQTPADLRRLIETCLRDPAPAAPAVISQAPAVPAEHQDTASSESTSPPPAMRGAPTRRWPLGIMAATIAAVLTLVGYFVTRQTTPPPVTPTPTLTPTSSPVATIAPTATPSPSLTPIFTPPASPSPSPTPLPTSTPSPTPSPTPLPTATPAPSPTPTPSLTLTPLPEVAVLPARYRGELRDGPGAKATVVPITIQLSADGTGGTISYGSRLGDTTVRFHGTREGKNLRAETGEVIAKPEKVQWKDEVFLLHFTADDSAATYECEKPKSALRGTLKREQPVQP